MTGKKRLMSQQNCDLASEMGKSCTKEVQIYPVVPTRLMNSGLEAIKLVQMGLNHDGRPNRPPIVRQPLANRSPTAHRPPPPIKKLRIQRSFVSYLREAGPRPSFNSFPAVCS